MDSAAWALATTAPNCERRVSNRLTRLDYPHLLFKLWKSRVWKGRVHEYLVPAFPSYVFVTAKHCWEITRDIYDVLGLVEEGQLIPNGVVEGLIDCCGGGDILPVVKSPERFRTGDKVVIGGFGPAAGHVGIYQYTLADERVCVLFDWLGQWVPVSVREDELSMMPRPAPVVRKRSKRRRRAGKRYRPRYQYTSALLA
jgi:hypothetical protein